MGNGNHSVQIQAKYSWGTQLIETLYLSTEPHKSVPLEQLQVYMFLYSLLSCQKDSTERDIELQRILERKNHFWVLFLNSGTIYQLRLCSYTDYVLRTLPKNVDT